MNPQVAASLAIARHDDAGAERAALDFEREGCHRLARLTRERAGLLVKASAKPPRKHTPQVPKDERAAQVLALIEDAPDGIGSRQIAAELGLTQSHVSSYIRVLVERGLVEFRRTGRCWIIAA